MYWLNVRRSFLLPSNGSAEGPENSGENWTDMNVIFFSIQTLIPPKSPFVPVANFSGPKNDVSDSVTR